MKNEGVGESGGDFLDVMGDEDEGGATGCPAQVFDELKKVFAGDRVKSGAGFVEDEELGAGHEGAGDEDPLPFALGEHGPGASGKVKTTDAAKEGGGGAAIGTPEWPPEIDHGAAAGGDGEECGFVLGHHLPDGRTDQTNAGTERTPVGFAIGLTEQLEGAPGGHEVSGEGAEEGGLPGAVGAEDDPVLAGIDTPVDILKHGGGAASDGQVLDVEDGSHPWLPNPAAGRGVGPGQENSVGERRGEPRNRG